MKKCICIKDYESGPKGSKDFVKGDITNYHQGEIPIGNKDDTIKLTSFHAEDGRFLCSISSYRFNEYFCDLQLQREEKINKILE